ncbi:MAG: hypothetical protein EZS28_049955 [Streblomastix strix]|uniref:Uncharacterized protein n=1 Tax=Streblomastix strix TaxID=222440 RepID=A0A5J4T8G4_9EUKA|nr:MAG: hypothetical protein EZS28_049955 [Streblomastix strix]
MDNISREVRNKTKIDNNIPGKVMESKGNEYKNVRREKTENDAGIEGLVQRNIQEQQRKDKTTSRTDRQAELPQTPNKRGVSVSNRTRQSEDTSIEDKVMG